ncbi:MAG: RHS repeat-associated core domain-containing protein, partial [Myxococcales bacterium]|nr:RHS repeat-associated core domain-containing protein [Myxococcales bacterium]
MEVRDNAQQAVYFQNNVVLPSLRHAYDAAYRVIRSEGRELAALGAGSLAWTGDAPREDLPHGNDSAAVRRFIQHFSYDANGNLLQLRHVAPANSAMAWTRNYTYDDDTNRMLSMDVDGGSAATVTHDALGQMLALPNIHALEWDATGRLRRSQRASGTTADRVWYVYDAGGQRVRKVSETWDAVAEEWRLIGSTTYVGGIDVVRSYAGTTLDEEREALHLSDGSMGSGGSGRMLLVETRTVEGGSVVGSPSPLLRFQFDNHLGSASLETTADGELLSYEEYHPYGSVAYSSGTSALDANPKRYRYSGKERDDESGLYYYGARYLAPWLGRWVSADPAGFVDGVNMYGFVGGRATSSLDPTGRIEFAGVNIFSARPQSVIQAAAANTGLMESSADAPLSAVLHDTAAEVDTETLSDFAPMETVGRRPLLDPAFRRHGEALTSIETWSDETLDPVVTATADTIDGNWARIDGALKVGQAAWELTGAFALVAAPEPAVSKAAGVALAVHALDMLWVGASQVVNNEYGQTTTSRAIEQGAEAVGVPETYAHA